MPYKFSILFLNGGSRRLPQREIKKGERIDLENY